MGLDAPSSHSCPSCPTPVGDTSQPKAQSRLPLSRLRYFVNRSLGQGSRKSQFDSPTVAGVLIRSDQPKTS
jgi:hypothetical protein